MSRTALLVASLLVSRCSLTATDRAERLIGGYDAAAALYGMSLEQLRLTDGVVVSGDPGADIDCFDSCSSTSVTVTGSAATQGPTSLAAVVERVARAIESKPPPTEGTGVQPDVCNQQTCQARVVLDGVAVVVRIVQQPTGGYSARLGQ